MPCTDGRDDYCHKCLPDESLKKRLDLATYLLCELLRELTSRGFPITKRHEAWYKEHKIWDQRNGR